MPRHSPIGISIADFWQGLLWWLPLPYHKLERGQACRRHLEYTTPTSITSNLATPAGREWPPSGLASSDRINELHLQPKMELSLADGE